MFVAREWPFYSTEERSFQRGQRNAKMKDGVLCTIRAEKFYTGSIIEQIWVSLRGCGLE
jgi:hypothetical protein